jgi:hypothetical protein
MKLIGTCLVLLFVSLNALSQGKPSVELSDTYMFTRTFGVNVPIGEDTSVNVPVNNWFGATGDFGVFSKSIDGVTATMYTYGGGPQFTLRTPTVQPYFRFILGGAHATAAGFGLSGSANAFFWSPGGGADFRITDHVWLRLGANYPSVRKFGETFDGIQALGGITYKFGNIGKDVKPRRAAKSSFGKPDAERPTDVSPMCIEWTTNVNGESKCTKWEGQK